jgi:hypothetical protein
MATATSTLNSTVVDMAGGVDVVQGTGPEFNVFVTTDGVGNWAANEIVELTVNSDETLFNLGDGPALSLAPVHAMAYGDRVFISVGDRVYISGIEEPTGWEPRYAGYGFITASGQRSESLEVKGTGIYGKKLVVFSRNTTQLWQIDPNPENFVLLQVLDNTGTISGASIVSYGELDLFFLSDTGIRSIRAREYVDLVNVKDVGTPIDAVLQPILASLTDEQKAKCVASYSPVDGRYWVSIKDVVYVFSHYPGSKIAAWSTYKYYVTPTDIASFETRTVDFAVKGGALYIRARTDAPYPTEGYRVIYDHLYSYYTARYYENSYSSLITTHATPTTIVLPFFDVKKPATRKLWTGINLIGTGSWKVYIGDDPANSSSFREVAVTTALTLSTINKGQLPISFTGTHLIVKLVHESKELATIAAVIIHYREGDTL